MSDPIAKPINPDWMCGHRFIRFFVFRPHGNIDWQWDDKPDNRGMMNGDGKYAYITLDRKCRIVAQHDLEFVESVMLIRCAKKFIEERSK